MKAHISIFCSVLLVLGCTPKVPTEPQPSPTELRYDTKHTMLFDSNTSEFRSVFSGSRCYSTTAAGGNQNHNFKFDGSEDTLTVTVADTTGLFPGDSFGYLLQQIEPSTSNTLQTWRIELINPSSATSKKHYFEFKIGNSEALKWDASYSIKGIYKLGQTNRPIGVDLEFKVGNTVNLLVACAPND